MDSGYIGARPGRSETRNDDVLSIGDQRPLDVVDVEILFDEFLGLGLSLLHDSLTVGELLSHSARSLRHDPGDIAHDVATMSLLRKWEWQAQQLFDMDFCPAHTPV